MMIKRSSGQVQNSAIFVWTLTPILLDLSVGSEHYNLIIKLVTGPPTK